MTRRTELRLILLNSDRAILECGPELRADEIDRLKTYFNEWWNEKHGIAILNAPIRIDDRRQTIPSIDERSDDQEVS